MHNFFSLSVKLSNPSLIMSLYCLYSKCKTEQMFVQVYIYLHFKNNKVAGAMELVPIRCRIPEHVKKIGKNQQWLAEQRGISKQQMSDIVNMRYILGMQAGMNIAKLLELPSMDHLYVWERRGE